jgi:hypothetical protein
MVLANFWAGFKDGSCKFLGGMEEWFLLIFGQVLRMVHASFGGGFKGGF